MRQPSRKSWHLWPAEWKWEDNYQQKSCVTFLKIRDCLGHWLRNDAKYEALLAKRRIQILYAFNINTNLNLMTSNAKGCIVFFKVMVTLQSITSQFINSNFSKGVKTTCKDTSLVFFFVGVFSFQYSLLSCFWKLWFSSPSHTCINRILSVCEQLIRSTCSFKGPDKIPLTKTKLEILGPKYIQTIF